MQARFPGTCRDCGNKFPAGTDIHYDRRTKKASCCNGSPQAAPVKAAGTPGAEKCHCPTYENHSGPCGGPQCDCHYSKPRADRAFIVDGAMKMEWVAEKTYQEGVSYQGDSVIYEERVYSGYNWMCFECKLVWDKQHQAKGCGSRGHAASYEDTYGVKEVRNGVPTGPNMYTITRTAIRREESKDTPPVAPAPQVEEPLPVMEHVYIGNDPAMRELIEGLNTPQVEEPAPKRGPAMTYMPDAIAETMEGVSKDLYAALWEIAAKLPYERLYPGEVGTQELTERQLAGRMKKNGASAETIAQLKEVLRKDKEELDSWMNETAPQADMTSEEMWESMSSVNQPTITTSWN